MKATRRIFLQLLAAVGVTSALSTPAPDAYQNFLDAVGQRFAQLRSDGYGIKDFIIFPQQDGFRHVRVSVEHDYSIVTCVVWEQKIDS